MRRSTLILVTALATAGCSAGNRSTPFSNTSAAPQARDVAAESAASRAPGSPPNVSPTAAPGVAFNYQYAFRVAGERIGEVQERHAQMCEQMGVQYCRITGMHFRQVDDETEGMLQFALEPSRARLFGRDAQAAVQQAEGSLVEANIQGNDVGTQIAQTGRTIQQMREDLARIERQIADGNVAENDKVGLRSQAEQLRQEIRQMETVQQDDRQTLATTPMTFRYGSDNYGSDRPQFGKALSQMWDATLWGAYGLLIVLGLLLPWILLGVVAWLVIRAIVRRVRRRSDESTQITLPLAEPPVS